MERSRNVGGSNRFGPSRQESGSLQQRRVTDMILKCKMCTKEFTFTTKDQELYAARHWSIPGKCKECAQQNSSRERQGGGLSLVRGASASHTSDQKANALVGSKVIAQVIEVRRSGLLVKYNVSGGESVSSYTAGRFHYNAKLQRPFIVGDTLDVIVLSSESHLISVCPTREFVRPLIILDVNGVLGEREKFESDSVERRFTHRPYSREFLEHCSRDFEMALWTCATHGKKGEADIFPSERFVFEWNQTQATNMWPRTSSISSKKPLFFKELSKVWKAFPCFDASNTLLIDDHAEKFERNPEGTCIVIPPYKSSSIDRVLEPKNKLCALLDELISAKESFQERCKDLIGKNEFFAPHPKALTLSSSEQTQFLHFLDMPYAYVESDMTSSDYDRFRRTFLEVACLYKKNVNVRLEARTLPGPRTAAFQYSHIRDISQPGKYLVCEKTDGMRMLLMFCKRDKSIFAISRSLEIRLFYQSGVSKIIDSWFDRQLGDTILDGELVKEYVNFSTADGGNEEYVLLVFDAIAVNGKNVGTDNSLSRRLLDSENWLLSADGPNMSEIQLPFFIRTKAMRSGVDVQGVLTFIDMNTNERCWYYRDERANDDRYHHSDGLVFTPATEIYHDSLALKWKPAEMISVDFAVLLNDIKEALSSVKRGIFNCKFPASCSHGNALVTLASIGIVDETDAFVIAPAMSILDEKKKHMIIECTFDKSRGIWRPFRLRTDKVVPNSVSTAWATLEVASASMSISELVENITFLGSKKGFSADYEGQKVLSLQARKVLGEASPYIILTKVGAGGADDIANHYDSIQRDRNAKCEGGKDVRMDMLRKVNNWAKAGMFMLVSSMSNSRDVMTVDQTSAALSYLKNHGRTLILGTSDSFLKYNPQKAPLELHSPFQVDRKQKKPFPYKERRVKALDICCGRGGDINKLTREFMLDLYVGIDLSLQELKEAEGRATKLLKQRKNPKKFMFIHGDAAAGETMHVLDVLAGRRTEPPERVKVETIQDCQFDLAFCQFALHYFCDDSERLRNILRMVSQSLKLGHRFSASFPNPYHVDLRLKGIDPNDADPGSLCTIRKVSFEQPIFENFNNFGIEYIFSLGDAVQNCKEFVVPLPLVIEMAREEGLALVKLLPMQDFILSMLSYPETDQLRTPMSVLSKSGGAPDRPLSDEEWKAIGVYCIAAWEKMA